jgi:hypothetical protein
MRVFPGVVLLSLLMAACSEAVDPQEAAFNDGYAFGYSRDCGATLANVDIELLDDPDYATAFARGRRSGEAVCTVERANNPRGPRRP